MMKQTVEERKLRIIARGEHSNHCHVVVGDGVAVTQEGDDTFIQFPEDAEAQLKHLLESNWIEGREVWTEEHADISLTGEGDVRHGDVFLKSVPAEKGTVKYKYIAQVEFDPFEKVIRAVMD